MPVSIATVVGLFALLAGTSPRLAEPPATEPNVEAHRDLAYVPGGDASQKLDLYLPKDHAGKKLPLIIWIHGGGWEGGDKNGCPPKKWLDQGYAAASIEYRFSNKAVFPAQIQDCQAAIRFLRANAVKYSLDADHIGVWGESAGGHLVALLGTAGGQNAFPKIGGNDDHSDRVQAVVDYYGPANFNTVVAQAEVDKEVRNAFHFNHGDPYSKLIGGDLNADAARDLAVSPVKYASRDAAPFLIFHGTKDALVPYAQSTELVAALKKAGAPEPILNTLPGAGHGGGIFWSGPVQDHILAFFDKHLKGKGTDVKPLPAEALTSPK